MLFCRAFLGCGTTSKPGKGKNIPLRLQSTSIHFQSVSKTFYKPYCAIEEIDAAGESAMCIVYGGLPSDDIDHLRYNIFKKKVTNASLTKSINPEELPPTKGSLKFHSRRTYRY